LFCFVTIAFDRPSDCVDTGVGSRACGFVAEPVRGNHEKVR